MEGSFLPPLPESAAPRVLFFAHLSLLLGFILAGTGINGVMFFAPQIFLAAGMGNIVGRNRPKWQELWTMMVGLLNVIVTVVAVFIIDRWYQP